MRSAKGLLCLACALLPFPTAAGPLPASDRILRVCDDIQEPSSLNPYKVFSEKAHTVLQQMLEGLVRFNTAGKLEPALARRWERINATTLRFHLRQGVRFHNGESLDAESVRFSLEKYVAPETRYPGLSFVGTIESVAVVDAHTVDVRTRGPDGLLLNRLAAWIHIVPHHYYRRVGDQGFSAHPVGTGPFKFEAREPGIRIVMEANPDYWDEGLPKVQKLIFLFVPWEKQVPQLLAGDLDIVTELPGTRTLEVMKNAKTKVIKRETYYAMACSLNITTGPLRDRRVRRAINYALNREDMIRYDVLGNGKPLAAIAMEGEEGYDPSLQPYPYDPQKARALLREAGHADGLKLKMLIKEQGARLAGILQNQFEHVGIKVETHFATDSNVIQKVAEQNWDIYIGGCPDPMVHSYFIKAVVLHSKSPHSIHKDPAFDRLLEDMVSTLDDEKRVHKAREIDRLVHDEALSLFMYQRIKTFGAGREVQFAPSVTGMPRFFDVAKN